MPGNTENPSQPPRWADRLLEWFCAPHLLEEIQGDLHEHFQRDSERFGYKTARWKYILNVSGFLRPFALKRKPDPYPSTSLFTQIMLSNYLKIALRNLIRNKVHSFINIFGLAAGMAVAMLIGLWIYDEMSFEKYNPNYDRIAQVKQNQTFNGSVETWPTMPLPMGEVLRSNYGGNFKHVVISSWPEQRFLTVGDKTITISGNYMERDAPQLMALKMVKGLKDGLKDPASIMLSESTAKAIFGEENPIDKVIKLENKTEVKVTGVYENVPRNSRFSNVSFIIPWKQKLIENKWMETMENPWGMNGFIVYVQIADNMDMAEVSGKIKEVKKNHIAPDEAKYKPEIFLHPMSKWHLYSEFKNGVNIGGGIEFVWLFGFIGFFVLLLACINFMNLSTARSEKRAKEVGIRKAVGSVRGQLIAQFFSESLLVVTFAFMLSLVLVQLILPFFNEVSGKKMLILWSNPIFWLLSVGFSIITGLISGSYPALYLSSFQPVKVLKGVFKAGRLAAVPRKVLVVVQFTVSVTLIIGTIIVFRQIQFAKNRPVGYNRDRLLVMQPLTKDIHNHFEAVREELKSTGAVTEMAESSGPMTAVWSTNGGFDWKGKDPNLACDFPTTSVSPYYGKTVGWQFKQGRDFSKEYATDSSAFVINEAAVKFMGLKNPIGEMIKWDNKRYKVIGVIKDMIVESPYQAVRPSLFNMADTHDSFIVFKLNPAKSAGEVIEKIENVYKKYAPGTPFDYKFVDEEFSHKFGEEERIGKLVTFFAALAIFISCLGLFGLASFMAEQRTKEIGIRKVLGATVLNLWSLLSKDFVLLVIVSFLIASPLAYYFMHNWLQKYDYRSEISWWIFAASGFGAMAIALLTVSYQAVKAALTNPVKSLKTE